MGDFSVLAKFFLLIFLRIHKHTRTFSSSLRWFLLFSFFFFLLHPQFPCSTREGIFYPSDSTRLRLASRLNYPLFLFSSIFLLRRGKNKSQKRNAGDWVSRGEDVGRMGIVPCFFVINLRNVKMMLTLMRFSSSPLFFLR